MPFQRAHLFHCCAQQLLLQTRFAAQTICFASLNNTPGIHEWPSNTMLDLLIFFFSAISCAVMLIEIELQVRFFNGEHVPPSTHTQFHLDHLATSPYF